MPHLFLKGGRSDHFSFLCIAGEMALWKLVGNLLIMLSFITISMVGHAVSTTCGGELYLCSRILVQVSINEYNVVRHIAPWRTVV